MNTKHQAPNTPHIEKLLGEATNELGDYFSRLGGSARYQGMEETDVPLFVCFLIAELSKLDLSSFEYNWVKNFERHGESSVVKARKILALMPWSKETGTDAINSYIGKINKSFRKNDANRRWANFLKNFGIEY